jgi:hypothetical protein
MNKEKDSSIHRKIERDFFKVSYPKGILKEYEKKVLSSGQLGDLLPMRFISTATEEWVYYEFQNHRPLDQIQLQNLTEAMEIIEKVLVVLLQAEDYLIDIGNICLDYRWIYYDETGKTVRLAYVPKRETLDWQISLFQLIGDVNGLYDSKDSQPYFQQLVDYMDHRLRTLRDLFLKIGELKREAHLTMGGL